MRVKRAFTMAEAILVMTILGIIATIMISTLRPADFKDKALRIQAKKVIGQISQGTDMIIANDMYEGSFECLRKAGTGTRFCATDNPGTDNSKDLVALYKKYLITQRSDKISEANKFLLKDGAVVTITFIPVKSCKTVFVGEGAETDAGCPFGLLEVDINGDEEPNLAGKDIYKIPFGKSGLDFEPGPVISP